MRHRTSIAFVAALGLILLLGACGDDAPVARTKPPKILSPTVDASLLTPPALTSPPPPGAPTPDEAALTLHDHWVHGDATAALGTATQQAVNELFAHPGGALDFQGCIREGSRHTCFFYYEGGGLNMIVRGSPGSYLVTKTFFVAD